MKVRVACAQILASVIRQEASLNTLIPTYTPQIPEQDHTLLQELCYGTLRHLPALQIIVEKQLSRPLKKKDYDILALLLSGLYQIREMRTPAHAAVNESVAACTTLRKAWAKGLINSTLRKYLREHETIDLACQQDDRFATMHPRWLQQMLTSAWGDRALSIMAANNVRPPMILRVNQQKMSRQDYLPLLAEQQTEAEPTPLSSQATYFPNYQLYQNMLQYQTYGHRASQDLHVERTLALFQCHYDFDRSKTTHLASTCYKHHFEYRMDN